MAALFLAAPNAALAQNECDPLDPPSADGATADSYSCDPQDYPDGITYTSDGDLTLTVPDAGVDFTVNDAGVNVSNGNAADNLFWDSSAYTSGKITGTDGAVLDYLSVDGDIDIDVGGVIEGAGGSAATHAIRAEATGTGSVSVTAEGDINPRGGFLQPDPVGIGIEALTAGGNITIATVDPDGDDGPAAPPSVRSFGTAPYAIHADSLAGGDIDIDIGGSVFASDDATHAILAETAGGDITINTAALVQASSGVGIEALANGGNIDITATGTVGSNGAGASGVITETSGAGTINLNLSVRAGSGSQPAMRAVAESGDITIDGGGSSRGSGPIISTHTDGLTTIDLSSASFFGSPGTGGYGIVSTGAGDVIVNVKPRDMSPGPLLGEAGARLDDARQITSPFNFSGLGGHAEVNFQAGDLWVLTDPNSASEDAALPRTLFSPGDDVVNVDARAMVITPWDVSPPQDSFLPEQTRYVVDFGAGDDTFNNDGHIVVGTVAHIINTRGESAEIRLENLETFSHAGTVWLGTPVATGRIGDPWRSTPEQDSESIGSTDSRPNDILTLPDGTNFHGVVDGDGNALGRIVADVDLGRISQTEGCGAEFRFKDGSTDFFGTPNFRLPVADCIDLRGGSASGRSLFIIEQMVPGDRGAYNPEGSVLVDVSGGDAAATDPNAFGVAPESRDYSPAQGGIVDTGLFFYTVAYDPAAQQFRLYGLQGPATQQLPLLPQAANGVWRTATDAWFDRRVDQRDVRMDAGIGSGAWFRVSRKSGDRELITPIVAGGATLNFDNSYSQDDTILTVGGDLISRNSGDSAWVLGGMVGYGRGEVGYDDNPSWANLEGMHAGLYGSFVSGDFYLDLALNQTWLDADKDVPNLALLPEGTLLETRVDSLGGQIEAGWRWRMGRFSVEPIAGFTYVKAETDNVDVPADDPARFGGEAVFEDATSQRGSLGLRLRMDDMVPGIVPLSAGLTARAIEEFDGESAISVINLGPIDAPAADTFDGTFVNVAGDVSITNAAKTIAGFIKVDGTFESDYESVGISAGLRYQW